MQSTMIVGKCQCQDRLIDGQLGTIKHIAINDQCNISKIYIKFDDNKADLNKISREILAHDCGWVPIETAEANIRVRASKDSSPVIN